jgi:TRAP-type C4-dicarboxylate transport system permease small subunit
MNKFWGTLTWLGWALFVGVMGINLIYLYAIVSSNEINWLRTLLDFNAYLMYLAIPVMGLLLLRSVLYSFGKRRIGSISLERGTPKVDNEPKEEVTNEEVVQDNAKN